MRTDISVTISDKAHTAITQYGPVWIRNENIITTNMLWDGFALQRYSVVSINFSRTDSHCSILFGFLSVLGGGTQNDTRINKADKAQNNYKALLYAIE